MQIIPLQPVPNQSLKVILAQQICQLNVYQTAYGLFMDVYSNGSLIIAGVICQNLNRVVRSKYLGFVGDFVVIDTIADDEPYFDGLGTQFQLCYLEATDPIPPLNGS